MLLATNAFGGLAAFFLYSLSVARHIDRSNIAVEEGRLKVTPPGGRRFSVRLR
jgi:hypothetical protein